MADLTLSSFQPVATGNSGGNNTPVAPSAPQIPAVSSNNGGSLNLSTFKAAPTTPPPVVNPNIKTDAETGQQYDQTDITSPLAFKNSQAAQIFNVLASSEKAFSADIAGAATQILPKMATGLDTLDQASKQHAQNIATTAAAIKLFQSQGKDTTKLRNILQSEVNTAPAGLKDLYPALTKTNWQVVGDAGGTLLDILSAGTYGEAAKGAETGALLTKAGSTAGSLAAKAGIATTEKVAPAIAEQTVKQTLGQTIKQIAKQTAVHSAVGAGIGYTGDVTQNLQAGKTGISAITPGVGTAAGAVLPALIGGVRVGVAIGKEEAPRFINSLIKPKTANFAYGHDPGRTVADLGITGNSLSDFEANIGYAKESIGAQISNVYDNPANANIKINADDSIAKIDQAIADAAKGGKSNQGIVTQLQNVKDGLLYEHRVNADGVIEKVPNSQPANLSNLSPKEAQSLIQQVASQTKFTGNPSDDKIVNSTLRDVYSDIRDKINTAVKPNNPEILKLNEQYGDLTSAELATRNRDAITRRANMISTPVKIAGTVAALTEAIANPHLAIPIVLGGATVAALEKAAESTAVKTRIASWLADESPYILSEFAAEHPDVTAVLRKQFPLLAAKLK